MNDNVEPDDVMMQQARKVFKVLRYDPYWPRFYGKSFTRNFDVKLTADCKEVSCEKLVES